VVPAVPAAQLDWTLELRDVTFWYPSDPDRKKIFAGLSLTIPA
jgi:hypothetical protein